VALLGLLFCAEPTGSEAKEDKPVERLRGHDRFILLIDNSASMSATDVAPHRLTAAKEQALRVIDATPERSSGMVIVFNSSAETVQSFTQDHEALCRAVRKIQPTHRPTRIEDAMAVAAIAAHPKEADDEPGKKAPAPAPVETVPVHLFSDGCFTDSRNIDLEGLQVHFHIIGRPEAAELNNVGIVQLGGSRNEDNAKKLEVFVRVRNFGSKAATVRLVVAAAIDGRVITSPG